MLAKLLGIKSYESALQHVLSMGHDHDQHVMFMPTNYGSSTTNDGGGFMNSTSDSSGAKKLNRLNNIVPCTCAEIFLSIQQDDRYVTQEGVELSQVCLVGIVRSSRESETRIDYEIDDYSGPKISVKQFVDDDESIPDSERIRPFREHTRVKVFGNVRNLQGARNIAAFKVVKITDPNEITAHLLEVIAYRMHLANQASNTMAEPVNSISRNTAGRILGLDDLQAQVHNSIREFMDQQTGISIDEICSQLRGVPKNKIREALELLISEGHVYTLADDDHFAALKTA